MSEGDTGTGFKPKTGTLVFLIVFLVTFIALVNMVNTQSGDANATEYANLEESVVGVEAITIPSPPTGINIINPVSWAVWFVLLIAAAVTQFLIGIGWFIAFILNLITGTGVFATIPDPLGLIIRVPVVLVIGFTAFYIIMVIVSYVMRMMSAAGSAAGGVVPG